MGGAWRKSVGRDKKIFAGAKLAWKGSRHRDTQVRIKFHQFSIFKENRQNKYRRNFLTERVCSCRNKRPSNVVGAGTLNEFKLRHHAHFAIFPLLYDHRERLGYLKAISRPLQGVWKAVAMFHFLKRCKVLENESIFQK